MHDLIIYGAGGFGRETALMIRQINADKTTWNILGFCDDNLKKGELVHGLPVIGGMLELNSQTREVGVVIAVAEPLVRKEIKNRIQNPGINFPALIHPTVMIGDQEKNSIDEGCILAAGTIMTTNIRIRSFVIINLSCTIGHDVTISEYCSVMPACSLSGSVTLGPEVLVGTGARILPGLTVGARSKVGAGAVVTRDVPGGVVAKGVPARWR